MIPEGAVILTAQIQNNSVQLWAEVDPDAALEEVAIEVFGTGHPMTARVRRYISTIQTGSLVFHIYKRL